ncbi:MAG: hypothetical protein ACUVTH_07360, partial [Thermogutta sp.]
VFRAGHVIAGRAIHLRLPYPPPSRGLLMRVIVIVVGAGLVARGGGKQEAFLARTKLRLQIEWTGTSARWETPG